MRKVRYFFIATACVAMSLSSCECQCQKSKPPGLSEQKPDFDACKTPPQADAAQQTPADKPTATPPVDLASQTPPPLPKDFPKDIPIMEGAEVAQVQNLPNNAHNVIFATDKPVAGVT